MKKLILTMLAVLGGYASLAGRTQLITDAGQLVVNNIGDGTVNNLIDNNISTYLHSPQTGDLSDNCRIQVNLTEAMTLGDDEDLVVFIQRCGHGESDSHPTAMKVELSSDGTNWESVWDTDNKSCHVYFLYRGPKTKEYSTRIHTSKPIKSLRFTVTANSGRKFDSAGHRYMGLAEFQIYRLGRNENYSENLIDRFHLTTDYLRNLKSHEFINTQSVLYEDNRICGRNTSMVDWCDWNGWQDGRWTKNTEELREAGVEMPDYTMITHNPDDPRGYTPDNGQQRQPTHVTEHILYAIPGDAIALYPYYSFTDATTFKDNNKVTFAHWYDYQGGGHLNTSHDMTGGATSMLDFLADPSGVLKNDGYGYFAGVEFGKEIPLRISTPQEYIDYVNAANASSAGWKLSAQLVADLDFSGYDNVPSLGKEHYFGTLEGNGHTISNLRMIRDEDGVGLVKNASNDAIIRNLIIDETCTFQGRTNVAAVFGKVIFGNEKSISNVQTYATVIATQGSAAALVGGHTDEYNPPITISNCYVGGSVRSEASGPVAAVAVWDNYDRLAISNTVSVVADVDNFAVGVSPAQIDNCYGDYDQLGPDHQLPDDQNSQEFIQKLGEGWKSNDVLGHAVPKVVLPFDLGEAKFGGVATFFCPRSPYVPDGTLQNLPFRDGQKEFVIAADFSQSFTHTHHITDNEIIEPVIQFRHIFRIRDGKEFAEEFSGSRQANDEYVRKNLRRVSARSGKGFQIRLDSPIPKKGTTRSKYYYKISDTDYRRVCTMNMTVTHLETGEVQKIFIDADGGMKDENGTDILDASGKPINDSHFYYGESFDGYGSRVIDGITYNICGGGGSYYTMLKCDNPKEGRYLVRITGNDINANSIMICDGSGSLLVVMEMELTFLPESVACMVTDNELYANDAYAHAREEELEKAYGAPKQYQNFDQYAALEKLGDKNDYLDGSSHKYRYKWPMPWKDNTYAYDYSETRDFNMYCVASHSSKTPYSAAAGKHVNPDGSKGLYDRLYYKTTRISGNDKSKVSYGYFYYVNAAKDPGVSARLSIEDICMGSTVHVSAWIAEFSDDREVANVSFNFIAVRKDGDRILLHSFISGYVPVKGEWMNVYYSFVPNYSEAGITPDDVDHFELELENNCTSSNGADYAIDNIRLYVVNPVVYAEQNEPICDEKVSDVGVRVDSPFDVLLQVVGETEAKVDMDGEQIDLYYTFIDKQKFDEEYASTGNGAEAYDKSVLRYNYADADDGAADQTFGKVTFNTCFNSNSDYPADDIAVNANAWKGVDDGTRIIIFNTRPSNISIGKEYYISIYVSPAGEISPGWSEFNIKDPCAKVSVVRVKPTSTVKIDGEVREDSDNISVCEGQKPVVQVDIYGKKDETSGTITDEPLEKNARMDWYDGTYVEFMAERNSDGLFLSEALSEFRKEYPAAENCDVAAVAGLTEAMIDYLKEATTTSEGTTLPKLCLSQTSYVFPSEAIPDGQDYVYCHVVAIPIIGKEEGRLICSEPTEVRIRVERKAPTLLHGLTSITYPDRIIDVPLRIGLRQLKSVSGAKASAASQTTNLRIPVRKVTGTSENATAMRLVNTKPYIFLVETNDPDYEDLGTLDDADNNIGLMSVGEIKSLTARIGGDENAFEAVLYNDVFIPKEGYYYRLRFSFEEDAAAGSAEEGVVACGGQDVFTIKVVPEYQKWNGGSALTDRNWNNDANWSRVEAEDLYLTADRKTAMDEFVADGSNKRKSSYAPLDFTKVIIPSIADPINNPPLLEKYEGQAVEDLSSSYSDISSKVIWTKIPSSDAAGAATHDIEYDMAAYDAPEGQPSQVRCRPWYSNTCEQIHFRPNSEIGGQGNLIYQKAWVDITVLPGRWHTLATPLKTVVAGDMYLPRANARQETELFQDITFSYGDYNRFAPAVYQRGWNKSTTTVFEIGGGSRNVALKADWSNVYNDVTEVYGRGTGFSIKTDVSGVTSPSADGVLFRLPKADASFDYFSQDGTQQGNTTAIDRTDSYRLNDADGTITSVSRGGNQYFLVGNPFMAHLDMQKFLQANSSRINAKYWVLTGSSQGVAIFDETSDGFVGTESGYVAPLQGFFLEAKDGAAATEGGDSKLELVYTADMACNTSFMTSPLRSAVHANGGNIVTISAVQEGGVVSQAFVNLSSDATKEYDGRNDAVLIDNSELEVPASVYTIGGNRALSVNTTDDVDGTEVGLITDADARTTLVFDGVDALTDVYLYDAVLDRKCSLYDGLEYTIYGPAAGRLFLMGHSEIYDSEIQGLSVVVLGSDVRIESGNSMPVAAKVYTTDGMLVADMNEGAPVLEFTLDRGIYILEATDSIDSVTRKVFVR